MFEDTHELAENKLLLLYIFKKIGYPISNTSITEIVLENGLLNYFQLQQYLSELVSTGFLNLDRQEKRVLYNLSSQGENVLEYFESRISSIKKEIIILHLSKHSEFTKKDIQITADFFPQNENEYIVTCRITENKICKIEIKLNVSSKEHARKICSKWKSDASEIYNEMYIKLTK